jgi:hypothetical protein
MTFAQLLARLLRLLRRPRRSYRPERGRAVTRTLIVPTAANWNRPFSRS